MEKKLLAYIQRVQALAQCGLAYTENPYDIERYQELRDLSVGMVALLSDEKVETIHGLFAGETGYQTPKVDVRAVVIHEGKILMVREKIDGCWSLPGGWADIGYTPGEVAVKETWEEAGLRVKSDKLLAVLDKKCHPHPPSPFYSYKIFVKCNIISGDAAPGLETSEVGFFGPGELPPLSVDRNTESQIRMMFEFDNGQRVEPVFD